jgi:hypothetical protein
MFFELTVSDGDALIFLCDYSDASASRLRMISSDDDEFDPEGVAPSVSSESSEAVGDDFEQTPGSLTSPTDQSTLDMSVAIKRTRSSADNSMFPGRRIATCRSRASFNGGQSMAALATRGEASFAPDLTMNMESGVTHGNPSLLPLVGLHQQVPSNMFGRIENHSNTAEMIHVAGNNGPPGTDLHVSSWSGIMPDMGPDPPAEMFGIPPNMTPTSTRHAYFGQDGLDIASDMQSGMHHSLVSPIQYSGFADNSCRTLPFRGTEPHHPSMMPTQEVHMEGIPTHYY